MRRFMSLSLVLTCPMVLAGLLFLPGCGGEEKKEVPTETRAPRAKKDKKEKAQELEAKTDGVLKGRVVIDGDPPKMAMIDAMAKHQDSKVCLSGKEWEKFEQTWIVGANKGVANVVVRLVPPSGKKFKAIPPEEKEVAIDQPHCVYVPHVVALKGGQVLKVLNTAPISHNTQAVGEPGTNDTQNVTLPPGGSKTMELNPQREPVLLSCQIHPWMSAKAYVVDHPYIAVTKEDGSFEMKNVPTGVELTLVGIHASGQIEGGKDGVKLTLKSGENTRDLKISAK